MDPQAFSAASAFLGAILTAIATFFAYRRQERKQELALVEAGRTGRLAGVAGAVASSENVKLYVEEFQRLTGAIEHLAKATAEGATAAKDNAEAAKENSRLWKRGLGEFEEIRRHIEDLAHSARNMRAVQQAMQARMDREGR